MCGVKCGCHGMDEPTVWSTMVEFTESCATRLVRRDFFSGQTHFLADEISPAGKAGLFLPLPPSSSLRLPMLLLLLLLLLSLPVHRSATFSPFGYGFWSQKCIVAANVKEKHAGFACGRLVYWSPNTLGTILSCSMKNGLNMI